MFRLTAIRSDLVLSTSHVVSKRLKQALTKPTFDPRSIFSDHQMKLGFGYVSLHPLLYSFTEPCLTLSLEVLYNLTELLAFSFDVRYYKSKEGDGTKNEAIEQELIADMTRWALKVSWSLFVANQGLPTW
ncbi:hypothetical protein COLO4_16468 [Corchorus olitorius]|uniref:Uncharacterized protein n=1 Tax=Corchorus olitorius TaxID=93759 RepID=A0A1R3JHA0_9ROSI|nr:hypothetical protein COLO4_16468 [Corchorus olitorius]